MASLSESEELCVAKEVDPVRATADDAVTAKLSASAIGYFADPYAAALAEIGPRDVPRRIPIINRGTWAR